MTKTITHMIIYVTQLESWRTTSKVTKADLARGLGIHPRTLHRYCQTHKFPWAHFKLLQEIIFKSGGDPNSITKEPVYDEKSSPAQRVEVTK